MSTDSYELQSIPRYASPSLGTAIAMPRLTGVCGSDTVVCPGAVYVADSPVHGRGVFAGRSFEPGDVIEQCPVLTVLADQIEALDSTDLYGFAFEWEGGLALALGYGSLYNHSWSPNARYDHDYERGLVIYSAVTAIEPGHEITVNYSGDPDGRMELWFDT